MREVILTVGPRASGKSGFCERVLAFDSSIVFISRDKILTELFGKTSLSPYKPDVQADTGRQRGKLGHR